MLFLRLAVAVSALAYYSRRSQLLSLLRCSRTVLRHRVLLDDTDDEFGCLQQQVLFGAPGLSCNYGDSSLHFFFLRFMPLVGWLSVALRPQKPKAY